MFHCATSLLAQPSPPSQWHMAVPSSCSVAPVSLSKKATSLGTKEPICRPPNQLGRLHRLVCVHISCSEQHLTTCSGAVEEWCLRCTRHYLQSLQSFEAASWMLQQTRLILQYFFSTTHCQQNWLGPSHPLDLWPFLMWRREATHGFTCMSQHPSARQQDREMPSSRSQAYEWPRLLSSNSAEDFTPSFNGCHRPFPCSFPDLLTRPLPEAGALRNPPPPAGRHGLRVIRIQIIYDIYI